MRPEAAEPDPRPSRTLAAEAARLGQRARDLERAVVPRQPEDVDTPRTFLSIPMDRSVVSWWAVARAALVLVLITVGGWVAYGLWSPDLLLDDIGDARWLESYRDRDHPATDLIIVGRRDAVVTTAGRGIHRLRLDGGVRGIWKTYDRRRTGGILPEDDLRQVEQVGDRLYFVGAGGSLTSCNRRFGDWQLHFGGGGFVSGLDLAKDLTALAVSPELELFAVGTTGRGAGLYDLSNRQWQRLPLEAESVTAMQLAGDRLWVGTDSGLEVLALARRSGRIDVTAVADRRLPKDLRGSRVHSLTLLGAGDGASMECVLDRGAHLSAPLAGRGWRVVVDGGDPALSALQGKAETASLLEVAGGVWMVLDPGPVFYDSSRRRLSLRSAGLEPGYGPRQFASPAADAKKPEVWLTAGRGFAGRLFRWAGTAWQPVDNAPSGVAELSFAGSRPLTRLADRRVGLAAADSGGDWTYFFEAARFQGPLVAGDDGGGELLMVADAAGFLHQYQPSRRSWERLSRPAIDVALLRILGGRVWVVENGGDVGSLSLAGGPYVSYFGTSELPASPGGVLTAESFKGRFWFVRRGNPGAGDLRAFSYDPRQRKIAAHGQSFQEWTGTVALRAVGGVLYLRAGDRLQVLDEDDEWREVSGGYDELLALPEVWLGRQAMGEVSVITGAGRSRDVMTSGGSPTWKKLAADRFGRLWGIGPSGSLVYYQRSTGSWKKLRNDSTLDLAIHQIAGDRDRVFAASREGLFSWNVSENRVVAGDHALLAGLQVRQLDFDGNRLWVLAGPGAGAARSLWSLETSGDEPRREWGVVGSSGFPSAQDWRQAVWAEIVDDELWWATYSGVLWRVSLTTPVWRWSELTPEPSSIRVSDDGVVWWLDAERSLHARDLESDSSHVIGSYVVEMQPHEAGFPDPPRPDASLWVLLVVFLGIALWAWGKRGLVPVFLLCLGVAGILLTGVLLWMLGTSQMPLPTRRIQFTQSVERYWLDGDEVTAETAEEGRWRFSTDGAEAELRGRQDPSWRPPADAGPRRQNAGWKVSVDGGLRIWRRDSAGTWQPVEHGEQGFLHDQIDSFAVEDGLLVAATPAGVAEYQLGRPLRWSRLAEHDRGGALGKEPLPQGRVEQGGFRWHHLPLQAELPATDFDPGSGRFRWDVALGLKRDREGRGWIRTTAGWRLVKVTDDRLELGGPRQQAPLSAAATKTWKVDEHWSCSRQEQPGGSDKIGLRLADLPPADDPFGELGRWPDLFAEAVQPAADATWIGTAAGVRRRDAGGAETLYLPGRRIDRLERDRDGSLYCRTAGDGDYRWSGSEWRRLPQPAAKVFGDQRILELELGDEVTVQAEERFEGELKLVDFEAGRFRHDAVEQVIGAVDGFWARTAAGVEHLRLEGTRIHSHRGNFGNPPRRSPTSARVTALLSDPGSDAAIFAKTADGQTWTPGDDGSFRPADRVAGNPFTTTRTGPVSDHVSWQRQPGSTRSALITATGCLVFENGKLTSDVVTAVGGLPGNPLQATLAGILTDEGMIPNPRGAKHGEDVHLAVARDRPWVRLECQPDSPDSFTWGPEGVWHPTEVTRPTVAEARFDGLSWHLGQVSEGRPRVLGAEMLIAGGTRPAGDPCQRAGFQLDGEGRFRFDVVRSVAGRSDRLWLAHDAGVNAFGPASSLRVAELFIPGRELLPALAENTPVRLFSDLRQWLWATGSGGGERVAAVSESGSRFRPLRDGEQELLDALSQPQWHGILGGSEATIELVGPHALEIESERTLRTFEPLADGVVALSGAGSDVLILTADGLQRLEAERLPRRSLGRPPSVCSFQPIYFEFRQRELDDSGLGRVARIAELLKGRCRDLQLWVDGYTDHLGTREGNAIMSIKRAGKVVDALVAAGVERSRLQVRPFGDRTARTDTDDPEELAGDRRVEINVRHNRPSAPQ